MRRETSRIAARVRRIERWADEIVAHEASAQFHRRPFVRLLEIGLPMVIDQAGLKGRHRLGEPTPESPVRVLHCPTDPVAKGSTEIREIVRALEASGIGIDYREVSGRPHREVLDEAAVADIVIDELYGDTPLGVLAAEAGWMGTPAICGGYFAGRDLRPLTDGAEWPTAFVTPEKFRDALRELLLDPAARAKLGAAAESFVQSRWAPVSVAQRMLAVVDDMIPAAWMVDPASIAYVDGYGMPQSVRIDAVRAYVDREGTAALELAHRADLVDLLIGSGQEPHAS
jgi:hypothetical protein